MRRKQQHGEVRRRRGTVNEWLFQRKRLLKNDKGRTRKVLDEGGQEGRRLASEEDAF